MAKGIFSQAVCVLTNGKTTSENVYAALAKNGFPIVKESPARESWTISGPSAILAYLPKVNGYVCVDLGRTRWEIPNPTRRRFAPGRWDTLALWRFRVVLPARDNTLGLGANLKPSPKVIRDSFGCE